MPHQCTNCGHTFPDGSKEMLSGCPDCGGNKFQFKPASRDGSPDDTEPTATDSGAETAGSERPSASRQTSPPETEGIDDSVSVSTDVTNTDESPAQSSARSEVVSSSEFTAAGAAAPTAADDDSTTESTSETPTDSASTEAVSDRTVEQPPTVADQSATDTKQPATDTEPGESSLDQLRKELNNQFESIRIVSPGQYELNLMELYDREEYIISLREDGRYVIEVPDGWGDS